MKINILPQKKFNSNGNIDSLGLRITLKVEADNKNDKKKLKKIWQVLEEHEDIAKIFKVMQDFEKEKTK